MRTGRPRRQGRLTSLSAEAAANRDTHPHERLRSRFFGHRVQCEARLVVRVFATPRDCFPPFLTPASKASKNRGEPEK